MKNTQNGFIIPLLIAIVAIVLVGGGSYALIKNKATVNATSTAAVGTSSSTTESPTTSASTAPSGKIGVSVYTNKAFSVNYPTSWSITENPSSANVCNPSVVFSQNPLPKQSTGASSTDYARFLSNSGSVLAVAGGALGGNAPSIATIKAQLSAFGSIDVTSRLAKMYFSNEDITVTGAKFDGSSQNSMESISFTLPKYNKKGEARIVALDGKIPQMAAIFYISPAASFNEGIINTASLTLANTLTSTKCASSQK